MESVPAREGHGVSAHLLRKTSRTRSLAVQGLAVRFFRLFGAALFLLPAPLVDVRFLVAVRFRTVPVRGWAATFRLRPRLGVRVSFKRARRCAEQRSFA
jgi:hypothetical protein